MSADTEFDVAIVGGGVSALAAAGHLSKVGMRWVLLEAKPRLGGRVWSSEAGTELGAEFVHGRHAKTWDYLLQANIGATRYPERSDQRRLYAFDNHLIVDDSFEREVERLFKKIEAYKGLDVSVDEFVQTLATKDRTALFFALDRIARLEGADTGKLSAKALGIERRLNTSGWENFRVSGGYSRLVESLCPKDGDVRLDTPVTRIEWDDSGVRLHTKRGDLLLARHALITVPLSVLKREAIEFSPRLPPLKSEAIEKLEMGDVTKVILEFSDCALPEFSYLSTNGSVRVWWRALQGDCSVLTGYTGGERSAAELAAFGDSAVEAGARELSAIFNIDLVPKLRDGRVCNWADEDWIWGAYSYTPVGALQAREHLRSPIRPQLFFAGEATSAGHAGTVHGAIETGLKAVEEIVRT